MTWQLWHFNFIPDLGVRSQRASRLRCHGRRAVRLARRGAIT